MPRPRKNPSPARWRRHGLAAALTVAALAWSPNPRAADEELVVIVHQDGPVRSVSKAQLEALFKAKAQSLDNGVTAEPVNLPLGSNERAQFDETVLRLRPPEVTRYWIDQKIRDGRRPPQMLPNDAAVVRHVQDRDGGIGYVTAGTDTRGVRVVARIRGRSFTAP
jgi:ABC-type phosphate transport system substrate-binding protein